MGIKYIEHKNGTSTPDKIAVEYAVKDSAGNVIKDTYYLATNPQGYTTNTGTVIGSSLTADNFVLGNGTVNVKASALKPVTSSTTWSTSSDVNVPTMKSISDYVTGLGFTSMVVLTYGSSTWNDFIEAYNKNAIVYCAVQGSTAESRRMAFLAFYNPIDAGNTQSAEFQYVRSVGSLNASNPSDQVIIYKLTNSNTWTTTTRSLHGKVTSGSSITVTPSGDAVSVAHSAYTAATAAAVKVGRDSTGHVVIGNALTAADVGASASSHQHYWANVQTAASSNTDTDPTFRYGTLSEVRLRENASSTSVKATIVYNATTAAIDFNFA